MLAQATKKHHAANPPMDTAESKAARSGALPSMASSSSVTQAPRRRDPHCAMAHLDHRRSWPLDSHVLRQLPSRRHPPRPADYLFVSLFTAAPQSALQWECSCSAPVQHSLAAGCSNPHRKLGCASRTPALRRAPQVTLRRTPRSYLAKFSRCKGRLQVVRTCPSRVHPPQYSRRIFSPATLISEKARHCPGDRRMATGRLQWPQSRNQRFSTQNRLS